MVCHDLDTGVQCRERSVRAHHPLPEGRTRVDGSRDVPRAVLGVHGHGRRERAAGPTADQRV